MADQTFHIGLCMAGAVSAGAYTAGVMDYLIEALAEWEKRRGEPGVPTHRVVISVIGGASAGGMTGIITAAAVNQQYQSATIPLSGQLLADKADNPFYHSWVDLLGNDMFSMMLDKTDIEQTKKVASLMNGNFIDTIASRAISSNTDAWIPTPPFFAKTLKVFTTLTNLEGIPYKIGFNSEVLQSQYNMSVHNDYACFNLNADTYQQDGWMPLNFKNNINTAIARDAAMATGAFPIGLKSRLLSRSKKVIMENPWLNQTNQQTTGDEEDIYTTQNIDGGLINNEPFEKVKQLLNEITGELDEVAQHSFNQFKSTVLMIDPFPSELPSSFTTNQQLFVTMGYTLNAITQQMRAKPVPLINALAADKAGQFLIAPTRPIIDATNSGKKIEGSKAIACGAFDGFSGFMQKEFRIHDYFLGRYNCEMFLRNYFTIPAESVQVHPIFSKGYEGVDTASFKSFHSNAYQIIPVFKPYQIGYYPMPIFKSGTHWPTIETNLIDRFEPAIKKRVEALLLYAFPLGGFWRIVLLIASRLFLNKQVTQ
ncbi:MAG: hypothetical protein FD136_1945, partial [Chitinophagaceae bacterium]